MNKKTIFVVEDDLSYLLELKLLFQDLGIAILGHADQGKEAIAKINDLHPDLIIMDIDIKGEMKGPDVAKLIEHLNIPVIFMTSFVNKEYYEASLKTNLSVFLAKPIDKFTFQSTANLLLEKKEAEKEIPSAKEFLPEEECFYVKKKDVYHRILVADILYIKAEGNYCQFFISNDKFMYRITLSALEKALPSDFVRSHRSYIVNLQKIDSFSFSEYVIEIQGQTIPMSLNFKPLFEKLLNSNKLRITKR